MNRRLILWLRVLLVFIWTGTLVLQGLIIPSGAFETARAAPEFAYLAVPYTACAIVAIGCWEAVLVALWALVTMTAHGTVFSPRAFRWVDTMAVAGATATVTCLGVSVHAIGFTDVGPLTVLLFLVGTVFASGAFTLLMLVMRRLLRSAVAMRDELAEVV
ncbi:MAG: DUF2975 domain-containing protein [Bifidobacteriaceae bacterium]|jgi:hypothetical protein|nr:DUF2975 domain-containing protein [Bifidobacteriaceae bacterium]